MSLYRIISKPKPVQKDHIQKWSFWVGGHPIKHFHETISFSLLQINWTNTFF